MKVDEKWDASSVKKVWTIGLAANGDSKDVEETYVLCTIQKVYANSFLLSDVGGIPSANTQVIKNVCLTHKNSLMIEGNKIWARVGWIQQY